MYKKLVDNNRKKTIAKLGLFYHLFRCETYVSIAKQRIAFEKVDK